MLQILDDGRLTDSRGRHVNFKNTIIIMTSNVGASLLENTSPLGFSTETDEKKSRYERLKDIVNEEMKKFFKPEFLNRLDDTIVFAHLSKEEIRKIVDIMLKDLVKRLAEQELSIDVPDDVKDWLAEKGYSPSFGARPLRRVIQKKIEDPIAEEILTAHYKNGDTIQLSLADDAIAFSRKEISDVEKTEKSSKKAKSDKQEETSGN